VFFSDEPSADSADAAGNGRGGEDGDGQGAVGVASPTPIPGRIVLRRESAARAVESAAALAARAQLVGRWVR